MESICILMMSRPSYNHSTVEVNPLVMYVLSYNMSLMENQNVDKRLIYKKYLNIT